MKYLGWVPVAARRLSFDAISPLQTGVLKRQISTEVGTHRFVTTELLRVSGDRPLSALTRSLIPFGLGAHLPFFSDRVRFFVIAHSGGKADPDHLLLRGLVVLFAKTPTAWRQQYKEFCTELERWTDHSSMENGDRLYAVMSSLMQAAKDTRPQPILCEFALSRDGVCELEPDFAPYWFDESVKDAQAHVANHAFFCVKDLFHHHYHHTATDDRRTVAVPLTGPDGASVWANYTTRFLFRSILAARRTGEPGKLVQALGQLVYLESFKNVIKARSIAAPTALERDFSSIRESIEVSVRSHEAMQASRRLLVSAIFLVPLSALALYAGLIDGFGAETNRIGVAQGVTSWLEVVGSNGRLFAASLALISFAFLWMSGFVGPLNWQISREFVRALRPRKRVRTVARTLFVASLLLLIGFSLIVIGALY